MRFLSLVFFIIFLWIMFSFIQRIDTKSPFFININPLIPLDISNSTDSSSNLIFIQKENSALTECSNDIDKQSIKCLNDIMTNTQWFFKDKDWKIYSY